MKRFKKLAGIIFAIVMVMGLAAGCGSNGDSASNGTILFMSSVTGTPESDAIEAYAKSVCDELGYEFKVVLGNEFNDPAENLKAVKNGMTSDVVGIILGQDGGVKNIMDEYPDLFVVGASSDMESVYGVDGTSSECATNEKFLGTIANGRVSGEETGKLYADLVIEKGYKKVATMEFPDFAFPNLAAGEKAFREEIEAYNQTVSQDEQIEIVGDVKVLMFSPLEDSWFLEEGNSDVDAIVAPMDGISFIYPTLKSAIANGNCNENTKLLSGGFSLDSSITEDVGGEGVISAIVISPIENIAWSIVMLDNAINGTMYSDYVASERISSLDFIIDSQEDIENVVEKTVIGTGDASMSRLTFEDIKKVLTRYTSDAQYSDLKEMFQSEKLSVESLAE